MNDRKEQPLFKSLLIQLAILFGCIVGLTGVLIFTSQKSIADANVRQQMSQDALDAYEDVVYATFDFPAHAWLEHYWYTHADEMDVEYDVGFDDGPRTQEKCLILQERYPDINLNYITEDQVKALPEEDQKLYAEIAYTWFTHKIDNIKATYEVDYLFAVVTDNKFEEQFFLYSGAVYGEQRGTEYQEIYPLGHTVMVNEAQTEAMRSAYQGKEYLAYAGAYLDYYQYLGELDGDHLFLGMTISDHSLEDDIKTEYTETTANAVAYLLLLLILILGMIGLTLIKPVVQIQDNIRIYRKTKDSSTIARNLASVNPPNEIGTLSKDVVSLALEIDDYMEKMQEITAETERISTELDLARRIQLGALPTKLPAAQGLAEFDICATMAPAKEVGGDFYDYFFIDETHLALVIGDVSGKGVPASLFMMAAKYSIENKAINSTSPAAVLEAVNDQLCQNNEEEMFVSVWLGILDTATGKIIASNAGHEYPAVSYGEDYKLLRDRHGIVLGTMEGLKYEDYEITLTPGSRIFVYTDGVPEATDQDKQMYGTDRMTDTLNLYRWESPEATIAGVMESISDFVNGAVQFDDITMLCLAYKDNEK